MANTSGFTKMHALGRGKAGTFVAVEPRQSMTAGNADEWLRSAPGTEGVVALAMLKVILEAGHEGKGADGASLRAAVNNVDLAKAAEVSGIPADTIKRIAHDFAGAKSGLALAGGRRPRDRKPPTPSSPSTRNQAVGAVGRTIRARRRFGHRQGESLSTW